MPEPKFQRPFGCPVYVLDSALQSEGGKKGKWEDRSRVGVYLGRSPLHARSVALVLHLDTGRVSPQYHVHFDVSCQTMRKSFGGKSPKSNWQRVCGFTKGKGKPRRHRTGSRGRRHRAGVTDATCGVRRQLRTWRRQGLEQQASAVDNLALYRENVELSRNTASVRF